MKPETYKSLENIIQSRMEAARTPAMGVALIDRDGADFVHVYGFKDLEKRIAAAPDTLFEIGSITKVFTGIAALQAVEAGLLNLHAPVTDYLPWFKMQSDAPPIITHHLLSHTAGIIQAADFSPDARTAVWSLRNTEVGFPPGERFYYSDLGYQVVSLVLEAVHGKPLADIFQEGILDPLNMHHTAPAITTAIRPRLAQGYCDLYDDRPSHPNRPLVPAPWLEMNTGDGCIASTINDMAKFARMLLLGSSGPNGKLLSESSFQQLTTEVFPGEEYGYGIYAFIEDGFRHLGHGGDMPGYESIMWLDTDNGLGVIFLAATPFPSGVSFSILRALRASKLGKEMPKISPQPPNPLHNQNAADYAGTFTCGEKVLTFEAKEDRLVLHTGEEEISLEKRGIDTFYTPHPAFDRFLFEFSRTSGENAQVVELFHGSDWYTNRKYTGAAQFEYPLEWTAFCGHYRSNNPWQSNFRVILRKGKLLLIYPNGEVQELVQLENNLFRVGTDATSPEQIRFSQLAAGKALRADLSGGHYYRFFTP